MKRRHRICLIAIAAALAPALAQHTQVTTTAPVIGYTITFFGDSGYPHALVEGAAADLSDREHIGLTDMRLTLFREDADRVVETLLTAPDAVLEPETELISGRGTVRLERDDLLLTGENWSYDHTAKRIQINRRAHIVFRAPLTDLLQ